MDVSAIISHLNGKDQQRAKNVTSPLQSLYCKPNESNEIDKKNCSDCVPSKSSATNDAAKILMKELYLQDTWTPDLFFVQRSMPCPVK